MPIAPCPASCKNVQQAQKTVTASVECLQDLIIVQDYCDGGDLAHYIFFKKKSNELVPETNIIQWLLGVPATYSLDLDLVSCPVKEMVRWCLVVQQNSCRFRGSSGSSLFNKDNNKGLPPPAANPWTGNIRSVLLASLRNSMPV